MTNQTRRSDSQPDKKDNTFLIYFDGSCRPNPGMMGIGVYCPQTAFQMSEGIGFGTNNIAEWRAAEQALIYGQGVLNFIHGSKVVVIGDSSIVVRALQGMAMVRDENLRLIYQRCLLLMKYHPFHFDLVPREKNAVADGLSAERRFGK